MITKEQRRVAEFLRHKLLLTGSDIGEGLVGQLTLDWLAYSHVFRNNGDLP
jgi:hypothetical protein